MKSTVAVIWLLPWPNSHRLWSLRFRLQIWMEFCCFIHFRRFLHRYLWYLFAYHLAQLLIASHQVEPQSFQTCHPPRQNPLPLIFRLPPLESISFTVQLKLLMPFYCRTCWPCLLDIASHRCKCGLRYQKSMRSYSWKSHSSTTLV